MPAVTVLIPAYNVANFVLESIQSILAQTFKDFELLIVIDPSKDGTELKVTSVADRRVRVINNLFRRGLSGSLNEGLLNARGKYIARMDADDVADPRRLSIQVGFLERHPEYVACGTWMKLLGERKLIRHDHNVNRIRARLLFNTQFAHPTIMIRAESLQDRGLFYDETSNFGEDYDLWLRLQAAGKMTNLRIPLVQYRRHSQSLSTKNAGFEVRELSLLRRKALRFIKVEPTAPEMKVHSCLADGKLMDPGITRQEFFAWCDKLQDGNMSTGYTTPGAMAAVLSERLWRIFRKQGFPSFLRHQVYRACQVYLTPR